MKPGTEHNAPAWGHYAQLRPAQIEAIRAHAPIAYLPWGALEWHSHHAPVGLDACKAAGICAALAAETGGLVLPAIPLGAAAIKSLAGFPHTIEFSTEVVARVAQEFCEQLAGEKFAIVVVLTGHYPEEHVEALKAGAAKAALKWPDCQFQVWPDRELIETEFTPDHAGATETSFQLHFDAGSVDLAAQPPRPLTLEGDGVTGEHPKLALARRGERQLDLAVRVGAARIRVLAGRLAR